MKDVSEGLRSPAFGRLPGRSLPPEPLATLFEPWMVYKNPPRHGFLRALMGEVFHPTRVRGMRDEMVQLADQLLDRVVGEGEEDFLHTYASPLPTTVIATLLGLPQEDHPRFWQWSAELSPGLDLLMTKRQLVQASRAARELTEYYRNIVKVRQHEAQEDLISVLVRALDELEGPHELSIEDVISNMVFLLGAGHETTTQVIAKAVMALDGFPEVRAALIEEPALLRRAADELIRWDSPVQLTFRDALEPTTVGGRAIRQGDQVGFVLGAANRDPRRFEAPEEVRLDRSSAAHLGFSQGPHFCLGAALARLEIEIALQQLLARYPRIRHIPGSVVWRRSAVLRGVESLRVEFGGAEL